MSEGRKHFSGQYYLLAVIGTALFFTIASMPNGFLWLYFFTPLPVIYYMTVLGFDRGLKVIAYAALVASVIALTLGDWQALFYSFSLIPTGVVLNRSINRQDNVFRSGLLGVITLGLTWFSLGVLLSTINHLNIYNGILQNIDTGLTNAFDAYSKSPDFPAASKVELQAVLEKIRLIVSKIFPGSLTISAILTVWLNMLFANGLLKRSGIKAWDDFKFWSLPEALIWLLIGGTLFTFVPSGVLPILGINIVLILGTLYFFQGLAVVASLLGKWSIPKPIKFLIFFVITIQAYGIILLALLGIADIWFNFRKSKLTNKTD